MTKLVETAIGRLLSQKHAQAQQALGKKVVDDENERRKNIKETGKRNQLFSECQQVINDSPCRELFEETNELIFNGEGKIYIARIEKNSSLSSYDANNEFRGTQSQFPGAALILNGYKDGKDIELRALAMQAKMIVARIGISSTWTTESFGLDIQCCYMKRRFLHDELEFSSSVPLWKVDESKREVTQDWMNPDNVANAIGHVLIEQGIIK